MVPNSSNYNIQSIYWPLDVNIIITFPQRGETSKYIIIIIINLTFIFNNNILI
jgi:hypothetical protein